MGVWRRRNEEERSDGAGGDCPPSPSEFRNHGHTLCCTQLRMLNLRLPISSFVEVLFVVSRAIRSGVVCWDCDQSCSVRDFVISIESEAGELVVRSLLSAHGGVSALAGLGCGGCRMVIRNGGFWDASVLVLWVSIWWEKSNVWTAVGCLPGFNFDLASLNALGRNWLCFGLWASLNYAWEHEKCRMLLA